MERKRSDPLLVVSLETPSSLLAPENLSSLLGAGGGIPRW